MRPKRVPRRKNLPIPSIKRTFFTNSPSGLSDAPRRPKRPPRPPQDGPRSLQEGPKIAQEGPKTAEQASKTAHEGPDDGPKSAPGALQ
eukprot:8567905-Pyramimonas_sp.AAC.1